MKTLLIVCILAIFCIPLRAQQPEKNGTIYIKHPYITAVENATKAYLKNDQAANAKLYSDTAKYWASGMENFVPIKEAFKMWRSDFDKFDSINVKPVGYPDYLEYTRDNFSVVQSWWTWSGISKKTGRKFSISMVLFDFFNKDGKIVNETNYGDWSTLANE
jgi:hypothetical protein